MDVHNTIKTLNTAAYGISKTNNNTDGKQFTSFTVCVYRKQHNCKKCVAAVVKKRCEIQGLGQEMAVLLG